MSNYIFQVGKIYLIKESNFVHRQSVKKSIKRKGHTRTTNVQAFASKFINRYDKLPINDINIEKNEHSVKELCTYNFKFGSFEKLTSLELCAKDTLYTISELNNPLNDVEKFIFYLVKLCNFDTSKGNTFNPSVNLCFYNKQSSFNQVKIPILKFYDGKPTQKTIKMLTGWLSSANYLLIN